MLSNVVIEKERYVSKDKTVLLKAYILDPQKSVLQKKLNNVNDIIMRMAMKRR